MNHHTYSVDTPAGQILDHLRRSGEATVREFETLLGISTTAVREHLGHLEARALLTTRQVRSGPGRPRLVYSLTARARELFPKEYDTLVTLLMREIAARDGEEQLQSLLDSVSARMAAPIATTISETDIETRLSKLRTNLESRGIPVEIHAKSTGFQIFACPYYDAAQEQPGLCAMDRLMLEQVLGEAIEIEGTIREGYRSCTFHLTRQSTEGAQP